MSLSYLGKSDWSVEEYEKMVMKIVESVIYAEWRRAGDADFARLGFLRQRSAVISYPIPPNPPGLFGGAYLAWISEFLILFTVLPVTLNLRAALIKL